MTDQNIDALESAISFDPAVEVVSDIPAKKYAPKTYKNCQICNTPANPLARGRCPLCYRYARKYGFAKERIQGKIAPAI